MTVEAKKALLITKHGLSPEDIYSTPDGNVIIKRSGIDKLEKKANIHTTVQSLIVTPYGSGVICTVYMSGAMPQMNPVSTIASASPDTCLPDQKHYPEIAYKRARHRILLSVLDLYQHNIYSDDESHEFKSSFFDFQAVVGAVRKAVR